MSYGIQNYAWERLQEFGARIGVTLTRSRRMPRLPQAEYLRRVFNEFKVSSVIDVGANEGQYRDFIRTEVDYPGPVVSVEPIPELAQQITTRALTDTQWEVEQIAMGPAPGVSRFLITAGSQFSSFHEPLEALRGSHSGQTIVKEAIDVGIDTLDSLIERHADMLGERIYLKLDTQGFDLEALKGLRKYAHKVVAMQSEASVRPIYNNTPDYFETIRTIEAMGFTLSQFFPNNEGHFPLLIEFDCHFVRLP